MTTDLRPLLAITKALADQNRLRVLCALSSQGELCVCQIHELLALAPSTTSKHLALLVQAGLLESRKEGRWVYYRLPSEAETTTQAMEALQWLKNSVSDGGTLQKDQQRLAAILSYSPEELCRRQAQGLECCSSAPETPAGAKSPKDGCGC